MDWPSNSSSSSSKLPVFVFPSSISFYADDNSSLKQILTLYNPYDFTIKFKVLSTQPSKYSVVDPEGSIRSRCYVDIVIRINDISPRNHNKSDEFRIYMYQQNPESIVRSSIFKNHLSSSSSSMLSSSLSSSSSSSSPSILTSGFRDITATLYASKSQGQTRTENDFEMTTSMIDTSSSSSGLDQHPLPGRSRIDSRSSSNAKNDMPAYVIILGLACVVVLLLPNPDSANPSHGSNLDDSWISNLWIYLTPKHPVKLCAAYFLGLLTRQFIM